eukprot:CAMPEP_0181185048 /NCGR_PEP_ID=MMETSP1096-20121128/9297_1 /TAXON_ID=156174 ORGANISM="Chrysochromulina ericina, Strain CCMP281" /NCGR_SAMPLE_ID=MMETSP1096 /ASSEMBLY_ACC=CAM_ASM_000453 /LENGTH=185 /DNA_ID=CAMNT_0023273861 /DNA_START=339 /DNA_END=897 /DNA_ORIENTATION=+
MHISGVCDTPLAVREKPDEQEDDVHDDTATLPIPNFYANDHERCDLRVLFGVSALPSKLILGKLALNRRRARVTLALPQAVHTQEGVRRDRVDAGGTLEVDAMLDTMLVRKLSRDGLVLLQVEWFPVLVRQPYRLDDVPLFRVHLLVLLQVLARPVLDASWWLLAVTMVVDPMLIADDMDKAFAI